MRQLDNFRRLRAFQPQKAGELEKSLLTVDIITLGCTEEEGREITDCGRKFLGYCDERGEWNPEKKYAY